MTTLIVDSSNASEYEVMRFATEASTLRIPVGSWPKSLATKLGNGQPFQLIHANGGEAATYRQSLGCIELTVFND